MCTRTNTCWHLDTRACAGYTYTHTSVTLTHARVHTHAHVQTDAHTHTHTHAHTHRHTHKHTHITHTYTHTETWHKLASAYDAHNYACTTKCMRILIHAHTHAHIPRQALPEPAPGVPRGVGVVVGDSVGARRW